MALIEKESIVLRYNTFNLDSLPMKKRSPILFLEENHVKGKLTVGKKGSVCEAL